MSIEKISPCRLRQLAEQYHYDRPELKRHRAAWQWYADTHYEVASDEAVKGDILEWLREEPKVALSGTAQLSMFIHELRPFLLVQDQVDMPSWLGEGRPLARHTIAFRNGILDLSGGELLPHSPDWFSANVLPYDYDPAADCPVWKARAVEWLVDDDQIQLLQEFLGYCLRPGTEFEKFLFMLGLRRSGKGTVASTFKEVLGAFNVAGSSLRSMCGEFGKEGLLDKQLVQIAEANCSGDEGRRLADEIKATVGRDIMPFNRKNKPIVSTEAPYKIMMAANQMPRIPDNSNAVASRMLLLRFDTSFDGREDSTLKNALIDEAPGILNWGLVGLKRLMERGKFVQPEAGKHTLESFAKVSSPKEEFLSRHFVFGDDQWVRKSHAFRLWEIFCNSERLQGIGTIAGFTMDVESMRAGVRAGKHRVGDWKDNRNVHAYLGMGLSDEGYAKLLDTGNKDMAEEHCSDIPHWHVPPSQFRMSDSRKAHFLKR